MPSLFLSHSSADKTFVEKLAKDLEGVGVNVWFDKWEIKVGDSLTGKIEEGLQANDYLGLVLSPAAVASEWVKAELSAAWCRQMSSRKIVVLPILYQDCEIPFLLEDRKYADFRTSYDEGFMALCAALGLKHSEALSENNWRLFMGDREADWKYYREQEYKRLVTRLVDRARQYNWSSWTGGTKNPLSVMFSAFIDRNKEKCIALRMVKGACQHIEAVLALCALDEVFLLERAAQVLFVGVDGEGRVIAVQVVDVDGDLLTALLRLRLVCLPNDERGSRQHKHDDEGDDAFVVFLLHFAFSFSC